MGGQVISGQVLSLGLAVDFWLTILGYGGGKFVSLGLDMLRDKMVRLCVKA